MSTERGNLIAMLLAFGEQHPEWVAAVVARLAPAATSKRGRLSTAELYEQLVRNDPGAIDRERRDAGPVNPQPVSRGRRLAIAWAEAEALRRRQAEGL